MGGYTKRLLKRQAPPPDILYMDTMAWVNLCREEHGVSRPRVTDTIAAGKMCLGFGQQTIAELADWPELHETFVQLVSFWPTVLISSNDEIAAKELARYGSNGRMRLPFAFVTPRAQDDITEHPVFRALRSDAVQRGRALQKQRARTMGKRLDAVKKNFSAGADGKYSLDRAGEFADLVAFQSLASRQADFVIKHSGDGKRAIDMAEFPTLRLFPLVAYYKFYNQARKPKQSDLGDLEYLTPIPYVHTVVMENDQADILRRIKRRHPDVLGDTRVLTLDAIREGPTPSSSAMASNTQA